MRQFFEKHKKSILNVLYPLIALGLVFAAWAIASQIEKKPILMPQLDEIFGKLFALLATSEFWRAVLATLLRTLRTFLLSFALALLLSLIGTFLNPVHRVLSPVVTVLRAAPTMAIILLSTIWLDYDKSPVLIGFLISFPLLYAAMYSALSGVDKRLIEMARVFDVKKSDQIAKIYLPAVLPAVLDSARSVISLTVKVVIAAEVIAQTRASIGLQMMMSNLVFDISTLIAWTITAIALSFFLEFIVLGIKKLSALKYGV
jgi:NitT/TauT family transport system permease protein